MDKSADGVETYKKEYENNNKFDFMQGVLWTTQAGTVNNGMTRRNLNYQGQLYWGRIWRARHHRNGTFQPRGTCYGPMIPRYREDWVFRTTYNYAGKFCRI